MQPMSRSPLGSAAAVPRSRSRCQLNNTLARSTARDQVPVSSQSTIPVILPSRASTLPRVAGSLRQLPAEAGDQVGPSISMPRVSTARVPEPGCQRGPPRARRRSARPRAHARIGGRVRRAPFPVVPEGGVRDLVVMVKLHVPITRVVLVPRRSNQIGLTELPDSPAVHQRDLTARAHVAGFTWRYASAAF